ncbi:Transposase IS66 family protein [Desulfomicrobium apsheronum]|uniref:Transposase IS66 family protein n=1 Tax=Desulfomicrobium apsheronum TaxID=52560 RepID=A0A1I3XUF3_9BACT|nr:Transposase IS66 family protein [Desulfomicrobium apsheronum]
MESIWAILDKRIAHIPPKSLLGKTMSYARIQWCQALRFVGCGLLTPDNNAVENTIRPVALGIELALCRNSPQGTGASVRSYPLWKQPAAKANEIEPQA